MVQARIPDFAILLAVQRMTLSIAQALGWRLVAARPTNVRLAEVGNRIAGAVDPLFEQSGVTLCWETFSGRPRFLSDIRWIAALLQRAPAPRRQWLLWPAHVGVSTQHGGALIEDALWVRSLLRR